LTQFEFPRKGTNLFQVVSCKDASLLHDKITEEHYVSLVEIQRSVL